MTYIKKASGDKEIFDKKKIQKTILKAGASEQFAGKVADKVEKKVYDGISTKKILTTTLDLLKEKPEVASRYDLKRAIMSLGPSGFPFEKFFAAILENYGYETKVGNFVSGKNVKHEVDIIAIEDYEKKRKSELSKKNSEIKIYDTFKIKEYENQDFQTFGSPEIFNFCLLNSCEFKITNLQILKSLKEISLGIKIPNPSTSKKIEVFGNRGYSKSSIGN